MEDKYYCPTCHGDLEKIASCGTVGYFCDHCKSLVSKSKMLSEEDKAKLELEKEPETQENPVHQQEQEK